MASYLDKIAEASASYIAARDRLSSLLGTVVTPDTTTNGSPSSKGEIVIPPGVRGDKSRSVYLAVMNGATNRAEVVANSNATSEEAATQALLVLVARGYIRRVSRGKYAPLK